MSTNRVCLRLRNKCRQILAGSLACRKVSVTGKEPVISFTFDDFPQSALHIGGTVLRRYGVFGTYYAALGLLGQDSPVGRIFSREELIQVVTDGHELGCHTFAHCHAWQTDPLTFEGSVVRNRAAMDEILPNQAFRTLSYPISDPRPATKRKAQKYFACCRGGGQTFNDGTVDLNNVHAFFLEQSRDHPAAVKDAIDRCCDARGWLVFATHDIAEQPTRFGCRPEFFEDIVKYAVASGARILPMHKACQEVTGH